MQATKNLPADYHHQKTLDLSNFRVALLLNLAAIPLLFIYGWLFGRMIILLRSINPFPKGLASFLFTISGGEITAFALSIILMVVLHELIHGSFFWLFTHARPRFSLKISYAFAAAPEWYLPRSQYIIVGISPFVVISVISILLATFVMPALVVYMLIIASLNAAGALADLIVVAWVLKQPKTILIKDEGDVFSSFASNNE